MINVEPVDYEFHWFIRTEEAATQVECELAAKGIVQQFGIPMVCCLLSSNMRFPPIGSTESGFVPSLDVKAAVLVYLKHCAFLHSAFSVLKRCDVTVFNLEPSIFAFGSDYQLTTIDIDVNLVGMIVSFLVQTYGIGGAKVDIAIRHGVVHLFNLPWSESCGDVALAQLTAMTIVFPATKAVANVEGDIAKVVVDLRSFVLVKIVAVRSIEASPPAIVVVGEAGSEEAVQIQICVFEVVAEILKRHVTPFHIADNITEYFCLFRDVASVIVRTHPLQSR